MKNIFFSIWLLLIGPGLGAFDLPPELVPLVKAADPKAYLRENPGLRLPFIKGRQITFLYQDTGKTPADKVSLQGSEPDVFGTMDSDLDLIPIQGTRWFFITKIMDDLDGLTYHFDIQSDGKNTNILDPLNPAIFYAKHVDSLVRLPNSDEGFIQVLPNVKPAGINGKRDVWVYLPAGYFTDLSRRYPVLYMQDGQQVWDSDASANGGWKANTVQEDLVKSGKVEPFIIVGIKNTSRRNEEYIGYSAYFGQDQKTADSKILTEGQQYSAGYLNFVADELKPLIDKTFRTKPDRVNTAIAGSSFGAGASLYIGFTRSDVFSKIGALSGGNYELSDESRKEKRFYQVFPYIIEKVIHRRNPMKVYADCGGKDVDAIFLPRTLDLVKALKKLGYQEGKDLKVVVDEGAGHNERAWAKRLPECFIFLFGK